MNSEAEDVRYPRFIRQSTTSEKTHWFAERKFKPIWAKMVKIFYKPKVKHVCMGVLL